MVIKRTPATGAQPQRVSLADQIRRAREEREAAARDLTSGRSRSILHGTGLTQKAGAKAATAFDRAQQGSRLDAVEHADDLTDLTNLPQQLIDPSIQLDPSQADAVAGLLREQFGCIIGKAGTGKSTTIRFLLARLRDEIPEFTVAFCAYTGRAVQQIRRQLPYEYHKHCDTIHGLLEYAPEMIETEDADGNPIISKRFIPHRTRHNPLTQRVIIVDEAGMCPIDLWNNLMDACPADTRVYVIGDIYQLPPVHGRSVLGFAMQAWPTYELDRIHRTDNNAITDGAWNIMQGRVPEAAAGSVVLREIADGSVTAYQQILAIIQHLSEKGIYKPLRDAIITPQNQSQLGQETLNERLCAYFNPARTTEGGLLLNPRTIITAGYTHVSFAVGDKVMVTQNDREQGLTNGMIGVIESITPNANYRGEIVGEMAGAQLDADADLDADAFHAFMVEETASAKKAEEVEDVRMRQASHVITVKFQTVEQPISFSTAGTVNTLQHAYAFTCHKAQGGEFPVVIIIVHASNLNMLTREWLYTAWTRAQGRVILLYNRRGLQQALNRQVIRGKTLADKAAEFIKIQQRNAAGDDRAKVPTLPARCQLAD